MGLMTIRAYAPASISCIFKVHENKDPRWSGSTGVGFTIDKGVVAEVKKSPKTKVFFNGKVIRFPTVTSVIPALTKESVAVRLSSELPLGYGFGLSGASALSSAYALNRLLKLKKTEKELAIIAHTADCENKTGLGDVANQYFGGFLVKFTPSSQFIVTKLPFENTPIYMRYFSKLSTPSVLKNAAIKEKVNQSATIALGRMKTLLKKDNHIAIATILSISKEFVVAAGLLNDGKTKQQIESIEKVGGHASMMILGNSVVSDIDFPGATKFMISNEAAQLL